jgi:hypothetical protein
MSMKEIDSDKITRVYARLVALKQNLPLGEVEDKYVDEYHNLLGRLEPEFDVEEFKIPPDWVISTVGVVVKDYKTGKSKYGETQHVQRHLFLTRIDGLLHYFELLGVKDSSRKTV